MYKHYQYFFSFMMVVEFLFHELISEIFCLQWMGNKNYDISVGMSAIVATFNVEVILDILGYLEYTSITSGYTCPSKDLAKSTWKLVYGPLAIGYDGGLANLLQLVQSKVNTYCLEWFIVKDEFQSLVLKKKST
uniref:ANF_receptor domain-containing protein n=1 Tax=Heterorhabditis bacteriophora TaxID=37862 RepID=A0A1I7X161_HETBA